MKRALALLALTGLLVAVSAGCGGDDASDEPDVSATVAWADDLCSAASAWVDELERIGDEATDLSSFDAETLGDAGADLGSATESFVDDIRALGAPDTEAGDEAQSLLEGLADTVEAEKQEIEEAIDAASGITGIATAVSTVAGSVATMLGEIQEAVDELRTLDATGGLETAFDQADACERFTSG